MGLKDLANKIKKESKDNNKQINELFLEELDRFLLISRSGKRKSSKSIKPSSYYKCIRSLWYDLLDFPEKQKVFPRSIRILENGTVLHEWIQTQVFMKMEEFEDCKIKLLPMQELPYFGAKGIEFIKEHKAPDMEIKFKDIRFTNEFPISAMIDGYMEFQGKEMLFEFKTINPTDFNYLFEPLKDHIKQGAVYALCLGVPRVMFLYYNKGDQQMKAYFVEYGEEHLDWVKNRLKRIENLAQTKTLPEKEEGDKCRQCAYKHLCDTETRNLDILLFSYRLNICKKESENLKTILILKMFMDRWGDYYKLTDFSKISS